MNNTLSLCHSYLDAKRSVIEAGFGWEVDWQAQQSIDDVTEPFFLREYAWVVFNAGFREQTMRRIFPLIEEAFCNFESASVIWNNKRACKLKALTVFRHEQKVKAVVETCRIIAETGFENILGKIREKGAAALQEFPFMGPATSLHLAKNLGINVVKPDRHLIRIATATGYKSPHEMCKSVQQVVGDSLGEIDIVFWRFATLNPKWFKSLELEATERSRKSLISLLKFIAGQD